MTATTIFLKKYLLPGTAEEWLVAAGSFAAILVSAAQFYAIQTGGLAFYKGPTFLMLLGKGTYVITGIVAAVACALSVSRLRREGFSWKVFCVLICGIVLWLLPVAQERLFNAGVKNTAQHVLTPRDVIKQPVQPAPEDESSGDDIKEQLSAIRARERFVKTGELIKVYDRNKGRKNFEPSETDQARRTIQVYITSAADSFRTTAGIWLCLTPLWLIAGFILPRGSRR
jgi:lysylphosphatidylglycerol synthetase-like protein (DUF2156 family)